MNQQRRNQINDIIEQLGRLSGDLKELVRAEKRDLDNIPEPTQDERQGKQLRYGIKTINNAIGGIEYAAIGLKDIFED